MADIRDPRYRQERYRHLFYDDKQEIPANKLGVKSVAELERLEWEALDLAYTQLQSGHLALEGPLTIKLLMDLHHRLFGNLYDWGGKPRNLPLSPWAQPKFIHANLLNLEESLFAKYPPAKLHSDEQFCRATAEIHGEFIPIHPFWNGNHRTIQLAIDMLAQATGRPSLKYDRTEASRQRFQEATRLAFEKLDYAMLQDIMSDALTRARSLQLDSLKQAANAAEEKLKRALDHARETQHSQTLDLHETRGQRIKR